MRLDNAPIPNVYVYQHDDWNFFSTFMNTVRRVSFRALIKRRSQMARWPFLLAAVPLMILALIGVAYGEYGGAILWVILILACLVQTIYSTLLGWGVVFLVFLIGLGSYAYTLGADLLRVVRGERPHVFLGPDDTIAFLAIFGLLIVVVAGLVFNKPKLQNGSQLGR